MQSSLYAEGIIFILDFSFNRTMKSIPILRNVPGEKPLSAITMHLFMEYYFAAARKVFGSLSEPGTGLSITGIPSGEAEKYG